jgi:hypothetical protein
LTLIKKVIKCIVIFVLNQHRSLKYERHQLSLFTRPLTRLGKHERFDPFTELKDALVTLPEIHNNPLALNLLREKEWEDVIRGMPLEFLLERIPFETVARVNYENLYFFDSCSRRGLEEIPSYRIVDKIRCSFVRWGRYVKDPKWDVVVDIYEQLRLFSVGMDDFSVTLDWTTGYHGKGNSESANIFLDGVFAYFLHYKGEHVMTIGFSFTEKGDLLI